jgi:hypothetical protein
MPDRSELYISVAKILADRPIAFRRDFAKLAGSIAGGLMLSQMFYWNSEAKAGKSKIADSDGWFYKTQQDWTVETTMSRRELEAARQALVSKGLISFKRSGAPAKTWYRLNLQIVVDALRALYDPDREPDPVQSRLAETYKLDCPDRTSKIGGNGQSLKGTEITTETTSETTGEFEWEPDEVDEPDFGSEINLPVAGKSKAKSKPNGRQKDLYFEAFAQAHAGTYKGLAPITNQGDFVQLAKLRKTINPSQEQWQSAVVNYFASPRKAHTLRELCSMFPTFLMHRLDKYNKPVKEVDERSWAGGG